MSETNLSSSSREAKEVLAIANTEITDVFSDLLSKGLACRVTARGHSMSPFLKDGDVITVTPRIVSPGIGHIVAFVHPRTRSLMIHRVIGRKDDSYLIKGDNTWEPDGYVKKEGILGIVTKVERDGKRVLLGQGPERTLIALLNREGLLSPLLLPVWKSIRPFIHWAKNRRTSLKN